MSVILSDFKVANELEDMVANMVVDMVANLEVDKVADMAGISWGPVGPGSDVLNIFNTDETQRTEVNYEPARVTVFMNLFS